jgi:drug/metabolite transporter (DMT)-like permease
MTQWLLVGLIVLSTVVADVLQSLEMKRHGPIEDFRLEGIRAALLSFAKRPLLLVAFACMALSFFSFMVLLSIAELSFAVPATAASYVAETLLAKYVLKERVDRKRWTGAVLVAFGVALLAV